MRGLQHCKEKSMWGKKRKKKIKPETFDLFFIWANYRPLDYPLFPLTGALFLWGQLSPLRRTPARFLSTNAEIILPGSGWKWKRKCPWSRGMVCWRKDNGFYFGKSREEHSSLLWIVWNNWIFAKLFSSGERANIKPRYYYSVLVT